MFHFGVGSGVQAPPRVVLASPWPPQRVPGANPGCLPRSQETVVSAVLSYFGACLTRLEVGVGTPTPPCYPNPLVMVVIIKTVSFPRKNTQFSPDLLFLLRVDEDYKESQDRL